MTQKYAEYKAKNPINEDIIRDNFNSLFGSSTPVGSLFDILNMDSSTLLFGTPPDNIDTDEVLSFFPQGKEHETGRLRARNYLITKKLERSEVENMTYRTTIFFIALIIAGYFILQTLPKDAFKKFVNQVLQFFKPFLNGFGLLTFGDRLLLE